MNVNQISMEALSGGQSQKIGITASAQTAAIVAVVKGQPVKCMVTLDIAGFIRKGANPTAVSDGTDQYLAANTPYRIELMDGEKLAAIGTAAGNMYFTPGA